MISEAEKSKIVLYMVDFWEFCRGCLGHRGDKEFGWVDLCEENKGLCRFMQSKKWRMKLILMPRYTLKSCIVTIGYSLWRILLNPNIRILIYSDSATKAQGFLSGIKNHILGKSRNSEFRALFGEWEGKVKSGEWNDGAIIVNKRTLAEKEPTVDTSGIETGKVGKHYDLIIFDDIVSDLNTTTKAQKDKVYDCYKKALSLLKPGGEVIMVGTRWSFGDAYGRILAENEGEWGVFLRKAEVEGKYPFEAIGLNKHFLDVQKKRQGSFIWSCLYQNNPVDDNEVVFKRDKFSFYGVLENTDKLYKTASLDPAGYGEDYTAITVVGTDNEMKMHVLDIVNRRMLNSQIINEIIKLSYLWKFKTIGVEVNFFENLEKDLKRAIEEERGNPAFTPFGVETYRATCKSEDNKFNRILSLQPYHERGHLLFPGNKLEDLKGGFEELVGQMSEYTANHQPIHDDILDSLAYQVRLCRKGQGFSREKPPENSFMQIYMSEIEKENLKQRSLPFKYRKYLQVAQW